MGSKLKLNQKVTIQKESDQNGKFYTSYIAAMEGDTISLATPMHHGRLILFNRGDKIRVYAWPLMFVSEVLSRRLFPHPLLVVQRPRVFIKEQKRAFVRLEASVPVMVWELTGGPLSKPAGTEVKTHTVDLSGGGALLVYPRDLKPGTWLEMEIDLPNKVRCRAQVRRVEHIEQGLEKVRLAVEFVEITQADQDKIMAFIFERQRELRRRGLL